jgi:hypothetical protein
VFRDSRGVVHTVSSSDPVADLPTGAARALQEALLEVPAPGTAVDLGGVLERCEAARELLDRWQDAFFASLPDEVDLAEEARWAARAGLSLDDVEADYQPDDDEDLDLELLGLDDDGLDDDSLDDDLDGPDDLELLLHGEPDEDDPRRRLPDHVVAVLERELLLLPVRVRLEALLAAVELVEQWTDLVADHEKLVGHLLLAHGLPLDPAAPDDAELGHEELAGRHAGLHAASGPGHPRSR